MKIKNIHAEILKLYYSNKGAVLLYDCDDRIVVVLEGSRIFLVEKSKFMLDSSKLIDTNVNSQRQIKEMLNGCKGYEFAELTNEVRISDSFERIKIKNDEKYAWVNRKSLKNFDNEATYRVLNAMAPVRVFENGDLVGLIMPIRVYPE